MKNNLLRAKHAVIALWVILGLEIAMLLSQIMQIELIERMRIGFNWTDEEVWMNDMREMIISGLYVIALIVSAVFFIKWFRRAYQNLHFLSEGVQFSEGWAAGAWFVPVLNLFRPYQIMKELYVKSESLIRNSFDEVKGNLNTMTIGVWWFFWLMLNVFGQIISRMARNADIHEKIIDVSYVTIASNIVGVIAALLAMKVIKDYSKIEPVLLKIDNNLEPLMEDHLLE